MNSEFLIANGRWTSTGHRVYPYLGHLPPAERERAPPGLREVVSRSTGRERRSLVSLHPQSGRARGSTVTEPTAPASIVAQTKPSGSILVFPFLSGKMSKFLVFLAVLAVALAQTEHDHHSHDEHRVSPKNILPNIHIPVISHFISHSENFPKPKASQSWKYIFATSFLFVVVHSRIFQIVPSRGNNSYYSGELCGKSRKLYENYYCILFRVKSIALFFCHWIHVSMYVEDGL